MNFTEKRTKIVATIGPSSQNYELLKEMVKNGVSVIRANASHGTLAEHLEKFRLTQRVSEDLNIQVSIMLDTKGAEVRVGNMQDGGRKIGAGTILKIKTDSWSFQNLLGDENCISLSFAVEKDLKIGDKILLDDGKLTTVVEKISLENQEISVRAINTHFLKSNKRVNLPGVPLSLPFLSEKDRKDIEFGVKNGVDYIAASFVNSAKDIHELRQLLAEHQGEHIQIIAKIESVMGTKNIDEIIQAADGVMIARGDLGLEIPFQDVPYFQKIIIRKCRAAGKPVIIATQMLDTMEHSPQPTRAEVTDVYYATELGADATMLSGESAQGKFPLEAVQTMSIISQRAELEFYKKYFYGHNLEHIWKSSAQDERDKIAYQTALKTADGSFRYAIVLSDSAQLLRRIAQYRPNTLIIGIVNNPKIIGSFGVTSSVFISRDSLKFYERGKINHLFLRDVLKPFYPKRGERFLVIENGETAEYSY